MDAYITRIENSCIDMAIDFCITENGSCFWCSVCDNFSISEFEWRTITRKNNFYWYDGLNGGFSTCMRDDKKIVSLKVDMVSQDVSERTVLRKKIEKLFASYDCCDDCCPVRVYFTDGDGEEYYFDAQAGSSTTVDNFQNTRIMVQYATSLEVCNNTFYNANTDECCGILGAVWGFRMPFNWCSCITGWKFVFYNGNNCADYTLTIQADKLVNPRFFNISKDAYYGIDWEYSWEITINTREGVRYNWNRISPVNRQKWSSLQGIGLKSDENELLLTADSWNGTWCISYWNDLV